MRLRTCEYHVFFTQLSIHTYGSISPDYIEDYSLYEFYLESSDIDRLFNEVQNGTAVKEIDEYDLDIRVKIICQDTNQIIYITKTKQVASDGKLYAVRENTLNNAVMAIMDKAMESECKDPDKFMCLDKSSYSLDVEDLIGTKAPYVLPE